jgi:hypothetical protein
MKTGGHAFDSGPTLRLEVIRRRAINNTGARHPGDPTGKLVAHDQQPLGRSRGEELGDLQPGNPPGAGPAWFRGALSGVERGATSVAVETQ